MLFICLISCKEDDATKTNQSVLPGNWTLTEVLLTRCDLTEDNDTISYPCTSTSCVTYSFLVDSLSVETYVIATLDGDITTNQSGDYSISDDRLSLCIDNEGEIICDNYRIVLGDDLLTLVGENSESGCTETLTLEKEEN